MAKKIVKPETEEKFETLMAEEIKVAPLPRRCTSPLGIGRFLSRNRREELPEGCSVEDGAAEIVLEDPAIEEKDYPAEIRISGPDRAAVLRALDVMIRAAAPGETRYHDGVAFFLHAVNFHWVDRNEMSLKYIFRTRPAEAAAERR